MARQRGDVDGAKKMLKGFECGKIQSEAEVWGDSDFTQRTPSLSQKLSGKLIHASTSHSKIVHEGFPVIIIEKNRIALMKISA